MTSAPDEVLAFKAAPRETTSCSKAVPATMIAHAKVLQCHNYQIVYVLIKSNWQVIPVPITRLVSHNLSYYYVGNN